MRTPPLLIGLALLLWGRMSGMVWIAVVLALLFEARWLTRASLELSDQAVTLFFDICLLIAAGSALYLFLSPDDPPVAKTLLVWLPMVFAPLALAQAYSKRVRLPFAALVRLPGMGNGAGASVADEFRPGFHFLPVYAGVTCIAAAGANQEYPYFFTGIAALLALFLYANRPTRTRPGVWAMVLVLALGTGFVTQDGIQRAQRWARAYAQRMLHGPYQVRTAIGDLGELKVSRRILLRVELPETIEPPVLLATAGYDFFDGSRWLASNSTFAPLAPLNGTDTYALVPGVPPVLEPDGGTSVRVFQDLFRGEGLLALPSDTALISGVGADIVEGNGLGSVLVDEAPGFIAYNATMRAGAERLEPPRPIDGLVPPGDRAVLEELVLQLGLREIDPPAAAQKVRQYFHDNFAYDVRLAREREDLTPLEEFLTVSRAGHCEYFATAATLLLRQAGIPARYTLGYAVWEPVDPEAAAERMFLVRESHTHSWPRYWSNGRWLDIDPTPPLWYPLESEPASSLQWLWDWRADVSFALMRWRYAAQNSAARGWLLAGAAVLAIFLSVRLARRGGLRRRREAARIARERAMAFGEDSPFFESIADVERRTPRAPGEPVLAWLSRAGAAHLAPLARLHYRYRFDPRRDPAVKRSLERGTRSE